MASAKKEGRRKGALQVQMAEWTGLEPATSGVTGQHSNQLNYHSAEPVDDTEQSIHPQHNHTRGFPTRNVNRAPRINLTTGDKRPWTRPSVADGGC